MKRLATFCITFLFVALIFTNGQNSILLQHKKKTNKQVSLDLSRDYTIKTKDTSYFSKIIRFTDTTLSIARRIKTGDTTYIYQVFETGFFDTVVRPVFKRDTLAISFKEIQYIQKDLFRSKQWLVPFFWCGMLSVGGIVLLPFVAIFDGKQGVKDWAVGEGTMIAISWPVIFIGTRTKKYNLKNTWIIQSKK